MVTRITAGICLMVLPIPLVVLTDISWENWVLYAVGIAAMLGILDMIYKRTVPGYTHARDAWFNTSSVLVMALLVVTVVVMSTFLIWMTVGTSNLVANVIGLAIGGIAATMIEREEKFRKKINI